MPWQWLLRLRLRRLICFCHLRKFLRRTYWALWDAQLLVDPYTDFAEGTTGVRVLQIIDIAVRHAESFAEMQDEIA